MQNCVSLSVPVLQTRVVEQDGAAGYAATYTVKKGQRVAAIAIGYADGFLRGLSSIGKVFFNDVALPVLGRVSMDVVIVDLSALPENTIRPGDMVEVFGPNQTPDAMAEAMGMIGYEVLTALGQRFERVYTP
jgi:alanine racemase